MNLIDISGKKLGRLTVVDRIDGLSGGHVLWRCRCECGNEIKASSQNLRSGHTQSCGCLQLDVMRKQRTKHGMTMGGIWAPEYSLWSSAKMRAAKKNIEFSIEPSDIVIPQKCPLLGFAIAKNKNKLADDSATLDRIDDKKGYTKENIWVISYKANRSKNNLSVVELRTMLRNLEERMKNI